MIISKEELIQKYRDAKRWYENTGITKHPEYKKIVEWLERNEK